MAGIETAAAVEGSLEEFEGLEENEALRKTIRKLERKLAVSKAKTADLVEAVYQAARDAAVTLGNPPAVPAPKPDKRSKHQEAALLLLSDWHVGKSTPSYRSEVARSRVELLAGKVDRIATIERADHPVPEVYVLLDGDFVDNLAIFPGQPYEVDSTTFAQVFTASDILSQLLRRLLSRFERVNVIEQFGNHGRIGRKGDYPRTDNLDLIVYTLARERLKTFEHSKRLRWQVASSWYSIVEIGAYRALLLHGDQIKSFGGNVPAYGISRKANAWASGVLEPFSDVYMGHFHQPLVIPLANGEGRVFVNPSIESDSAYAKEFVAATGTPGQRLNFIDPKKGRVTSERILWVDEC